VNIFEAEGHQSRLHGLVSNIGLLIKYEFQKHRPICFPKRIPALKNQYDISAGKKKQRDIYITLRKCPSQESNPEPTDPKAKIQNYTV